MKITRWRSVAPVLAMLFVSAGVAATEIETFLVPFWFSSEVSGANGSRWVSELTVANTGDEPITIDALDDACRIPGCPRPVVPPGTTIFPLSWAGNQHGVLLTAETERMDDLALSLLIRDVSRADETMGTSVPVVSERDAFVHPFSLIGVPVGDSFRTLLRIYTFDYGACVRPVTLRVYRVEPRNRHPQPVEDELLLETELSFIRPYGSPNPGIILYSLDDVPELADATRLRIDLAPRSQLDRIWAVASVTHNETQQVTLFEPRPPSLELRGHPDIVEPSCTAPAPLQGTWNFGSWVNIVRFRDGVDAASLSAELANRFGFTLAHVFSDGFAAEMDAETIARLRCLVEVESVHFDGRGCGG